MCKSISNQQLNELIENSELSRLIVSLNDYTDPCGKEAIEGVREYNRKHPYNNEKTNQVGRTWILIGITNNKQYEAITVGQSLDIIGEIQKIIGKCFDRGDEYNGFLLSYEELRFYEIVLDAYLNIFSPLNKDGIKDLAYELSKDYLVEALIAHKTSASHWNKSSGMDKRFYDHFFTQ
jgi:hypothetical protein